MIERLRRYFERLMEAIVVVIVVALALIIVAAVIFRLMGNSFSWYDEVASVLLAWLTYYGAALAAAKRAHIGFEGIVEAVPKRWGLFMVVVAEAVVIGFFAILAWTGWEVLQVLAGDTLVSLPQVSVQITQSVIPIGAVLFIAGQLLSLPEVWRRVKAGEKLHSEVPDSLPVEPQDVVAAEIEALHEGKRERRP
ncbi:MAG: TRAP transporter small permease [Rhodovibrionaceae bacterium]|nr:TRAP transporter small permease [Rhodovibrionaceae bacterium]